jgi:hypothetical protein
MIKIKLQHFGSNYSKAPISTIEIPPSTPSSPINYNYGEEKSPRRRYDQSSANEIKKIVLNSVNSSDHSFEPKKAVNLNRSKSANEASVLRNSSSHSELIKINNLNLNTKNNGEESQKVWKRSILRKQSLKQKKIIEWANRKPDAIKRSVTNNDSLRSLFASPVKPNTGTLNEKIDEEEEDNDDELINFTGDATAAIVQKSDMERSLRAKLFEGELIDLSRARFKKLDMMDFQKRLFIDRQLKKARSLPGLLRCTALQAAQAQAKAQDHKFHSDVTQNRNTPADDYIDEINHSNKLQNFDFNNGELFENIDESNEDYVNLVQARKSLKKDKFREMLESNDESILNINKNLVIRKSSQFPSQISSNGNLQAKGVKKSKTFYHSSSKENSDYNTISEISSNYYPNSKSSQSRFSNSISNTEDQYKSSETDSLNAQGLKSSRNKVPHVSFFLDPSGVNIGEQNSGINFNNNNTNSVQSSGSKNGKKVISLHLQFANNANPLPLNENSVSASLKQKSFSFREDNTNAESRLSGRKLSSVQQNRLSMAFQLNNQVPTINKYYFENNNELSTQNNDYYTPLNNPKYTPISDNRFQDLLRIVKPPYLLNEIKDVNKIIEKNDALKESNLDIDTREKMNKMKEKGYKLAVRAKKAILSGDYIV